MVLTVFILDDSINRHQLFEQHLSGAQITRAHTASEAYPLLRHRRFDVVFLDHDLEMSGAHHGSGTEVVTAIGVLTRVSMYPSEKAIHCVHSANLERAEWMYKTLRDTGLVTKRCTEAWLEEQALLTLASCGAWELPERWTSPLVFE